MGLKVNMTIANLFTGLVYLRLLVIAVFRQYRSLKASLALANLAKPIPSFSNPVL